MVSILTIIYRDKGFSLIEILVAASVLSLSLFASVAMVRKSQELSLLDQHRRAAKSAIERALETSLYTPDGYYNLNSSPPPQQVFLDQRNSLQGTLTTSISAEQIITGANEITIPHKRVVMTVSWQERSSANSNITQTVSLEKWLSP